MIRRVLLIGEATEVTIEVRDAADGAPRMGLKIFDVSRTGLTVEADFGMVDGHEFLREVDRAMEAVTRRDHERRRG